MKKAMKKDEIIKKYKEKYGAIIHPNPLTDAELRMLDFCISIASELPKSETYCDECGHQIPAIDK